jgi:hypothetical protein
LSITNVAREVVQPLALIQVLYNISQGNPIVRYKDMSGRPCMRPLDGTEEGIIHEVVYPTPTEMMQAAKMLWDRIEPKENKLVLEMLQGGPRPKVQLTGAALDRAIELREELRRLEHGDDEEEGEGDDE